MKPHVLAAALGLGTLTAASVLRAQDRGEAPDTVVTIKFGGFVDGYYAYDFNRPESFDRSFTTQPARANEFNVNLAYVEAALGGDRLRGRLALQAGTSVQSNYAAEPTNGSVSGPSLARNIQEAFVGYQLTPTVWIDAGIFYSDVGMESWISRDNPTYTRSLVADYSPYYSSGAKATWQATPRLAARLDVVNGWQNISETNTDKGVGARLDYALTPTATLSYYNFIGNESGSRLRVFNGVGTKASLTERVQVLGQFDVGSQQRGDGGDSSSTWYGFTFVGRVQVTPAVALAGRVERFDDEDQVLIVTGTDTPAFRASGASVGLDVVPQSRLLWRTELRGFSGEHRVFPDRDAAGGLSKSDALLVSSLALTF
jgi:hypothetical protein